MIKIVADSGCDLAEKSAMNLESKYSVVPLCLQLEDKHYIDDENLDKDEYVAEMVKCPTIPKTAAPSPEQYMENYKGEESVFAVTLSSKLSSSYSSAMLAKQMYLEEIGHKFIHVFDSLSASVGEALVVLKLDEFSKHNLSDNEMVEKIESFIQNMKTYFILDRYDNLVKTGRMNAYIAKIASVLSIKPICGADNGNIVLVDKARGHGKAIARLVDIIAREAVDAENRILAISHVKCLEKAFAFKEEIVKRIKFKDILILEASGLCSTYANKDGIIVSY